MWLCIEPYYFINSQILYHLFDQECPITYVHPSLFWEQKHIDALEVDVERELQKLQDNPPRFVIMKSPLKSKVLLDFIEARYEVDKTINERILIYELKSWFSKLKVKIVPPSGLAL